MVFDRLGAEIILLISSLVRDAIKCPDDKENLMGLAEAIARMPMQEEVEEMPTSSGVQHGTQPAAAQAPQMVQQFRMDNSSEDRGSRTSSSRRLEPARKKAVFFQDRRR